MSKVYDLMSESQVDPDPEYTTEGRRYRGVKVIKSRISPSLNFLLPKIPTAAALIN